MAIGSSIGRAIERAKKRAAKPGPSTSPSSSSTPSSSSRAAHSGKGRYRFAGLYPGSVRDAEQGVPLGTMAARAATSIVSAAEEVAKEAKRQKNVFDVPNIEELSAPKNISRGLKPPKREKPKKQTPPAGPKGPIGSTTKQLEPPTATAKDIKRLSFGGDLTEKTQRKARAAQHHRRTDTIRRYEKKYPEIFNPPKAPYGPPNPLSQPAAPITGRKNKQEAVKYLRRAEAAAPLEGVVTDKKLKKIIAHPGKPRRTSGAEEGNEVGPQLVYPRIEREINRAAESGKIEHPETMDNTGLVDIVGELIPDQPLEIATLPVGGTAVLSGAKATANTIRAARAGAAGAQASGKVAKVAAGVEGGLGATKAGRAVQKVNAGLRTKTGRTIRYGGGGGALATTAATGDLVPAVQGTWEAIEEDPWGVAKTTARGLASAAAAPALIGGNLALTTARALEFPTVDESGKKDVTKPVETLGKEMWDEAKKEWEVYTSKDPEKIKEATLDDYGLIPASGAAWLAKGFIGPTARHAVATGKAAKNMEAPPFLKGEEAPPIFGRFEDRRKSRIKRHVDRYGLEAGTKSHRATKDEVHAAQRANQHPGFRSRIARVGRQLNLDRPREGMRRHIPGQQRLDLTADELTGPFLDLRMPVTRESIRSIAKGADTAPEGSRNQRLFQAIGQLENELLDNKHFNNLVELKRLRSEPMTDSPTVGYITAVEEEARRRGVEPPPLPEDAVPQAARPFTDARTREEAVGSNVETYRRSEINKERKELRATEQKLGRLQKKAEERGAKGMTKPLEKRIQAEEKKAIRLRERLSNYEQQARAKGKPVPGQETTSRALLDAESSVVGLKAELKATQRKLREAKKGEKPTDLTPKQQGKVRDLEARRNELKERIAAKQQTMGPVKLTREERAAAVRGVKGAEKKKAALRLAQSQKRERVRAEQEQALVEEFKQMGDEATAALGGDPDIPAVWTPHQNPGLGRTPSEPGHESVTGGKYQQRTIGGSSIYSQGKVDYGPGKSLKGAQNYFFRQARQKIGMLLSQQFTQTHDLGNGPDQREFDLYELERLEDEGRVPANTVKVSKRLLEDPDSVGMEALGKLGGVGRVNQSDVDALNDLARKEGQTGDTYYLMDKGELRMALDYFRANTDFEKALLKAGTFQTRLLLATSFSWMVAQVVAEAGLLLGVQSPVALAASIKNLTRIRKNGGKPLDSLEWIAGGSLGADPAAAVSHAGHVADLDAKAHDLMGKTTIGRMIGDFFSFKYAGDFDRFKGTWLRQLDTLAEMRKAGWDKGADSRLYGALRGLNGTWKATDEIAHHMRGLSKEEQLVELAENPAMREAADELMISVDRLLGNWTAMSPFERKLSQFVIFYPYTRYSLDFILRTFPSDHPIRYTLATQIGQWNAEQLEELLTESPGFFTDWLQAPIYGGPEGEATALTPFSRITVGGNTLVEGIGDSSSLWQVVTRSMHPIPGALLNVAAGKDKYGENPNPFDTDPSSGWEDIRDEIFGLSPLSRTAQRAGLLPGPQSMYEAAPGDESGRDYAVRAGLFPFLPRKMKDEKTQAEIGELWDRKTKANEDTNYPFPDTERDKYEGWMSEDESDFGDMRLKPGLGEKDIEYYVSKLPKKAGKYTIDNYRKYLELRLADRRRQEGGRKATKQLIRAYGGLGAEYEVEDYRKKQGLPESLVDEFIKEFPGYRARMLRKIKEKEEKQPADAKPLKKQTPGPSVNNAPNQRGQEVTVSGPNIAPDEAEFYKELAKQTGVDIRALAAQGTQEGGADNDYNVFNIGWTDSGRLDLTYDKAWANPKAAAKATAEFMKGNRWGPSESIANIIPLAAGKGPDAAVAAFGQSDWSTADDEASVRSILPSITGGSIKNPKGKPFANAQATDATEIINPAWDEDSDGHGLTYIAKGISPVVKRWAKKYDVLVGEAKAAGHDSPGHTTTGTATDLYPKDNSEAGWNRLEQGLAVLGQMGFEVGYDGSVPGTLAWSNHGRGNHAHVEWVGQGSQADAIKKMSNLTNADIAAFEAKAGSGGGTQGGVLGGGPGTLADGTIAPGTEAGKPSYTFDLLKQSGITGLTDSKLPGVSSKDSVSATTGLTDLPELPTIRKKKRKVVPIV